MKKEINIILLLAVVLSFVILGLSSLECVKGITYDGVPVSSTMEPRVITHSLISLISVPAILSLLALLASNTGLNIFACVMAFLQSVAVTVSPQLYNAMEKLFRHVGEPAYDYKLTGVGIIVCVMCWILFLVSLVMTNRRSKEKQQEKKSLKTAKLMIIILSLVLAGVSIPVLLICVAIVTEASVLVGIVLSLLTGALIFFSYYFPVRKTIKTKNGNYLWIMVAVILLFLVVIVFRDVILDFLNDIFCDIAGPNSLPSAF